MSGKTNTTGAKTGVIGTISKAVSDVVITGGHQKAYNSGGNDYISAVFVDGGPISFPSATTCDFIIVGGGGSGGYHTTVNGNGGGGAGGAQAAGGDRIEPTTKRQKRGGGAGGGAVGETAALLY